MLSAHSAGAPVARGGGRGRTGGGAVHSPKCLLGASRCQAPPGLGRTGGWMSVHPVRATPVLRAPPPSLINGTTTAQTRTPVVATLDFSLSCRDSKGQSPRHTGTSHGTYCGSGLGGDSHHLFSSTRSSELGGMLPGAVPAPLPANQPVRPARPRPHGFLQLQASRRVCCIRYFVCLPL